MNMVLPVLRWGERATVNGDGILDDAGGLWHLLPYLMSSSSSAASAAEAELVCGEIGACVR
jgi:hypothetical protein